MNPLQAILSGGLSSVMQGVSGILDHFIASPDEKLKAQLELTKLDTDFRVQVMQADKDFAVEQAKVITAETQSESWMARNWRPILMLTFTFIIAYNYIFSQLFSVKSLAIPPDMWDLLKLGITGYIVGRSAEKIVPDTIAAMKK